MGIVLNLVKLINEQKGVFIVFFLISVMMLPVICNFNFILYGVEPVHALHQYQFVMLYVFVVVLIKNVSGNIETIAASFIIFIGCLYVRYDNVCYMEAEMQQQQAISYMTTLISDIHNTEGYYLDIPVCYVNENDKLLMSNHSIAKYDTTITNPFQYNVAMTYSWRTYMYEWCNYSPASIVALEELSEEVMDKVEELPRYPDNGSIKVIDGILIIKF